MPKTFAVGALPAFQELDKWKGKAEAGSYAESLLFEILLCPLGWIVFSLESSSTFEGLY